MNVIEKLKTCLALQAEIDAKTMDLRRRYRDVIKAERARGNEYAIKVEIDGEIYALEREDLTKKEYREAIDTACELGGFYLYRLVKKGKVIL